MDDKEKSKIYYTGFSDGLYTSYNAVVTLLNSSEKSKDLATLKLQIARTGEVIAEIMEQINANIEKIMSEKEK